MNMRLVVVFAFCAGVVQCSSKYLDLDKKTQSTVLSLGKHIFGPATSANMKPLGILTTDNLTKHIKQQKERTKKKRPDPKETWAVWQNTVQNNKFLASKRKEKIQRKNKGSSRYGSKKKERPSRPLSIVPNKKMNLGKKQSSSKSRVALMMSQFKKALRTQILVGKQPSERIVNNMSEMMASGIPDISSGFAVYTQTNVPLQRRGTIELTKYQTNKKGAFIRGSGVNLRVGRFRSPATAAYSFHATVIVSIPKGMQKEELSRKDFVTASICIDGQCKKHMSISSTSGLGTNSRIFSLNVSGYLYLEANRFVSLIVHNNSPRYNVNVVRGSYFSGMLVGS